MIVNRVLDGLGIAAVAVFFSLQKQDLYFK